MTDGLLCWFCGNRICATLVNDGLLLDPGKLSIGEAVPRITSILFMVRNSRFLVGFHAIRSIALLAMIAVTGTTKARFFFGCHAIRGIPFPFLWLWENSPPGGGLFMRSHSIRRASLVVVAVVVDFFVLLHAIGSASVDRLTSFVYGNRFLRFAGRRKALWLLIWLHAIRSASIHRQPSFLWGIRFLRFIVVAVDGGVLDGIFVLAIIFVVVVVAAAVVVVVEHAVRRRSTTVRHFSGGNFIVVVGEFFLPIFVHFNGEGHVDIRTVVLRH